MLTVLIESNEDQGVLHELLVEQHSVDQILHILGSERDIGVMGVVFEVGGVKHVHGRISTQSNILSKVFLCIDNILAAGGVVADIIKGHEGVVLAIPQ